MIVYLNVQFSHRNWLIYKQETEKADFSKSNFHLSKLRVNLQSKFRLYSRPDFAFVQFSGLVERQDISWP